MSDKEQPTETIATSKLDLKKIFNHKWIVKNIPFFLFLAGLAVFYIYNGHTAEAKKI
jgi:hypothetical protein